MPTKSKKAATSRAGGRKPRKAGAATAAAAKASKQDQVLRLLRRGNGATIDEIVAITGWQAHSVRGFMSGALKRRLDIPVVSTRDAGGVRHYHVAAIE